jgi:hypothetical protein
MIDMQNDEPPQFWFLVYNAMPLLSFFLYLTVTKILQIKREEH